MASTPAALTIIRGHGQAWPIQAYTTAGPAAVGLYDGTETLTVQVYYGDDAVSATLSAGWISGPSGEYAIQCSKAQSATLAPGSYTLIVTASRGPVDGPLLKTTLIVEPAPGVDSSSIRALAQQGEFVALVPEQSTNPAVASALESATRAIEALCRRPLVLGSIDKFYRPGRTRKIYLDAWPVQGEITLSYRPLAAATVTNTDASNQQAAVSPTPVPGTRRVQSLVLSRTASGILHTTTLAMADYDTIADLADAVSGVGGGWSATASNEQNISLLPTTRLIARPGRFGVVNRQIELVVFSVEMADYLVDSDRGEIELQEMLPEAYRYADRASGYGHWGAWSGGGSSLHACVRAEYRGGYATTQADLDAGFEAVPQDLKAACCLTAQAILSAGPLAGVIKSQTSGTRKYELRDDATSVPMAARPLLSKYVNNRIGGWGF